MWKEGWKETRVEEILIEWKIDRKKMEIENYIFINIK